MWPRHFVLLSTGGQWCFESTRGSSSILVMYRRRQRVQCGRWSCWRVLICVRNGSGLDIDQRIDALGDQTADTNELVVVGNAPSELVW